MANQDYYQILGVTKDVDMAQIKVAYRDLAFRFHPDTNKDNPDAVDKMKQINEAYAVLSDSKKRRDYDSLRQQYDSADAYTHFRKNYSDQDIFTGTDIHTVFNEFAKSFGFRNFDDISQEFYGSKGKVFEFKGSDFSFKGFFFGRLDVGKSSFKVPLPGKMGWIIQALLQNISGKRISLKGKNLYDTIQISPDIAKMGGPYAYFHRWKSKKLVVKIPPNVPYGQQIRLSGMGKDGKGGGKSGDLYLKIETKLSLANKIRKYLPF
ncbi:MAG: DnaJ domain-containing protein [Desulfobacula sp.]|jgi:DnaJ-class molecular chaperone|uniref:J domain-containing protein n=1 Tax=Desulfobacula sp. TaxID=2593537 RepID=UPI001D49170A|nr:DnaJ domain-containing protein [Desulfobacula sp.]MBT3485340.1 DnaJ domain-containing protein [Desulfobacula sp.]MBT3803808.1 DnaJ domain-containing protein [Desulfobacula sp.]MBT4026642.1 DnaJ domain-containing protein [Desulfobacula sp.]MBT4200553.1 DnaJ domain-containing protein [Desulfobacula sp.]